MTHCFGKNQVDMDYFTALQADALAKNPSSAAEKWNRRADFWEQERKWQCRDDQRVEATMAYLSHRGILTPDCRVADIGCGPGRFVAAMAQRSGSVLGIDISQNMVAYGKAHCQSLGITNASFRCCDFGTMNLRQEGYERAFDLVFSSLTPALHSREGLQKAMEMSRAWCLNISHVHRENHLRRRMMTEIFHREPMAHREGRTFYSMFNLLFLMGYHPETSFTTRRKENRVRPDEEYVEFFMEHALPREEQTRENAAKIQAWLTDHTEEDGCLTEVSDAVYGRILWDVRDRYTRPDYRSSL